MHEGICWFALLQRMWDSLLTSRLRRFHSGSTQWDVAQKNLSSLLRRSNNSILWFCIRVANNSGSCSRQMFALKASKYCLIHMFIHHSIMKEIVCPTLAGYAATHCKEMMILREEGNHHPHHVQTHYIRGTRRTETLQTVTGPEQETKSCSRRGLAFNPRQKLKSISS